MLRIVIVVCIFNQWPAFFGPSSCDIATNSPVSLNTKSHVTFHQSHLRSKVLVGNSIQLLNFVPNVLIVYKRISESIFDTPSISLFCSCFLFKLSQECYFESTHSSFLLWATLTLSECGIVSWQLIKQNIWNILFLHYIMLNSQFGHSKWD